MNTIKKIFFPEINIHAKEIIDEDSTRNIYYISLTMAIFELISIFFFAVTRKSFGKEEWFSIMSASFCTITCLSGFLIAKRISNTNTHHHLHAMCFKIIYTLLMSIWAIWASSRQYQRGEQIITFFSVELIIVCFIPLRPWLSASITCCVYAVLYIALYSINGAIGINPLNYSLLVIVSLIGMIIRFHSVLRMAKTSAGYLLANQLLAYNSRHDGLTGLRNRTALEEDVPKVTTGKNILAHMIDINYFKEINDTYGHAAGDKVLREAAKKIKTFFPEDRCYRYGGDEFLVLGHHKYPEESYRFSVFTGQQIDVQMSIGSATGSPKNQEELFELIARADDSLYRAKRNTHAPEYGEHERWRQGND